MAILTAVVDAQITVTVRSTGNYVPIDLTVSKFRFKQATGGETSTAWLAAADTSVVLSEGAYPYVRLRFLIQNSSGTDTTDNNALLEYRESGAYTSDWQDAADSNAFGILKDSQVPKWETSDTISAFVYIKEARGFLAVDNSANVIKRGGQYDGETTTLGQLTVTSGTVKSASFISDGAGGITALCVYVLTASSTTERLGWSTSTDDGNTWATVTSIGSMAVTGTDISTPTIIRRTTESYLQVIVRNDTTMFTVQSTDTVGSTWGTISTFGTNSTARYQMSYAEGAEKILTYNASWASDVLTINLTDWDIATGVATNKSTSGTGEAVDITPDDGIILRGYATSSRITIFALKNEAANGQPNSDPFLVRVFYSYGFSPSKSVLPLQPLSSMYLTHDTANFISVVDVKEISATRLLLVFSYNEWTADGDAVRLGQIEYNLSTNTRITGTLKTYPMFKNADLPGVTTGSTQAFNMKDFYNKSIGPGVTLISDNYRYLTTPVNINYLVVPNYFGSETDYPLVSNTNTTQQLGAGTFVSSNKGYSRHSIVPANIEDRTDVAIATGSEYEVEFFLDITGLPTKKKYEFRLNTISDTQRMLPYRDYDDHATFRATGASSWTLVGTFSASNGGYGGGYAYQAYDATGATETLTRTLVVTDHPCYYTVAVVTKDTTALASGTSTIKLKVDSVTKDTMDMETTRNALLTTDLLLPGTYTIQVEKIQNHSGDRWIYVNGFTREYNDDSTKLLYGSANTFTHSGDYPSITLDSVAADVESRVVIAATGRVAERGAAVAQATVVIQADGTQKGNILFEADVQASVVITVAGIVGQAEPGAAVAAVSVTLTAAGISYRTLQRDFRFRFDDGDETSAAWAGAVNAEAAGVIPGEVYRVRFSVENTSNTAEASVNRGHLEVSDDGGDYYTMGMNDYGTPLISPVHSMVAVSTITPSYAGELTGVTRAVFFITQTGVWVTAYRGKNASDSSIQLIVRVSINEGATWVKKIIPSPYADDAAFTFNWATPLLIREDTTGAIVIYYSDWASGFSVDAYNYTVRSTTDGLSWAEPKRVPVMITPAHIYYFFIDSNNDYIIPELRGTTGKYHVSTDQGDTWATYIDTSFPTSTLKMTRAHYELDETGTGLTVSFLAMTLVSGSYEDPVNLYEYIDASPYSGFPNLGDDDVGIRVASVTTGLSVPSSYLSAGFTMRLDNDDGLTLAGGLLSTTDSLHTFIIDTPSGYKATAVTHAESDSILPSNFLSGVERVFVGRNGMEFRSDLDGGFFLQCGNVNGFVADPHRTPGFMGYQELSNSNARIIYSPVANKWYYADVASGTVTISEMYYSGVGDGEHATQQISSGSFGAVNYGNTHFNTIHGSAGIVVSAGDTVEYEYAFTLEDAANIEGKVICMRPSGLDAYTNVACFTVPSTEAVVPVTVVATVNGDTDGPHAYPTVAVVLTASGEAVRNVAATTNVIVLSTAAAQCSKEAQAVGQSIVEIYSDAKVLHPAQGLAEVSVSFTAASTNTRPAQAAFSIVVTGDVSEPTIYVACRAVVKASVSVLVEAYKDVSAAASLHSYVQAAVAAHPEKLCISITVYQSPSTLTIVQDMPLTVVDIPATLGVIQESKPDLTVTQQPPLRVYI